MILIRETPELYHRIVKPYIDAFPPSRTEWVDNILSHKTESHKIVYEDPSPNTGFLIIPDMKWDLTTLSSLYLVAIVHTRQIRSLRDLTHDHLPLLRKIRSEAVRTAKERWGIENGGLRMYIHYQPSYYHFHVHIVNINHTGFVGQSVGHAHLLDDVISLLEIWSPTDTPVFQRLTLTYDLGEQHALFEPMRSAQVELDK